ncbi:MAG: hypothetical protein ACXWUG_19540 [Polyangiales bacterium]
MLGEPKTLCVDCKVEAPQTDNFAMLSKLGWRCVRAQDFAGHSVADWRCPACADKYKRLRALRGMASGFHAAVLPPKKTNSDE